MAKIKHTIAETPGEIWYRENINLTEMKFRQYYELYREWRMWCGEYMNDIDHPVSDQTWETFNAMRNVEYSYVNDKCKNYAILEMKHARTFDEEIWAILDRSTANKELCNAAGLPFFVVKYWPKQQYECWEFSVYAANEIAMKLLPTDREGIHMSEKEYLSFIYITLRGKEVPKDMLEQASDIWRPL